MDQGDVTKTCMELDEPWKRMSGDCYEAAREPGRAGQSRLYDDGQANAYLLCAEQLEQALTLAPKYITAVNVQ